MMVVVSGVGTSISAEVLGVTRGLLVREKVIQRTELRALVARALGMILAAALVGFLLVGIVMAMSSWHDGDAVVTAGVIFITPMSIIAEGTRAMHYARRKVAFAFSMTCSWIVAQGIALLAGVLLWKFSVVTVIGSWGIGACTCAVIGCITHGTLPQFSGTTRSEWRRRASYGFEYLATAGPGQLLSVIAAAAVGLPATGSLRSLQTVYGPLNILLIGIRNVVLPGAAEKLRSRQLIRGAAVIAIGAGVVTSVLTAILATTPLGVLLMSTNWPSDNLLLPGFALGRLATAVVFGAVIFYRVSDLSRQSTLLRLASAIALLAPFAALASKGLNLAIWSSSLSSICIAGAWWLLAIRHERHNMQRGAAPAIDPSKRRST